MPHVIVKLWPSPEAQKRALDHRCPSPDLEQKRVGKRLRNNER
jgi:hypothetical protein